MAPTIAIDPATFDPILAPHLKQPRWLNILEKYLAGDFCRDVVSDLDLENSARYGALVAKMEDHEHSGIAEIRKLMKDTTPSKASEKESSLFVNGDSNDEEEEVEVPGDMMMQAVANAMRDLVDEHQCTHPGQFSKSLDYTHHSFVVTAAFAEAIHEVQHDRAGQLRGLLLG